MSESSKEFLLNYYNKDHIIRRNTSNRSNEDLLNSDLDDIKTEYRFHLNLCMERLEELAESNIINEDCFLSMCNTLKILNSSISPTTLLFLIRKIGVSSHLLIN
jgi:hypothetical protein